MAAGRKGELVPRPAKKVEYDIRFASAGAKKGWRDLVATMRKPDGRRMGFPHSYPDGNHFHQLPAEGGAGDCERGGQSFERWQHKPTLKGSARIWFYIDDRTVFLEAVHTSHPNETK